MPLYEFHLTRTRTVSDEGAVSVRAASLTAAKRAYDSSDLGYIAEDDICWDQCDETTETIHVESVKEVEDDGSDADRDTEPLERIMELHDMAKEGADEH